MPPKVPKPKDEANNIQVCVRVRPFNKLELDQRSSLCIDMPNTSQVVMTDMAGAKKTFDMDRCYWSHKPSDSHFASQETLMSELGQKLQDNALDGYNACLFAYGQTGSGKTYSVLGAPNPPELRGLLPRMIENLFEQMDADSKKGVEFKTSVTYIEIYNEVIKDLLNPHSEKLEVRQSPQLGIFIQGLKDVPCFSHKDVAKLLDFGAKARTVGATCMNDQSSRSHCIFTVEIISKREMQGGGGTSQLRAKMNLVDLAGSERQAKTQASGERLKEGSAINKSLSNLAMVINKLAEASVSKAKKNADFVPFRNSKLTHVLQDSLSGNSRTVMIAALSPALYNYDETLSTLRFAQSVKKIVTKSHKNEESEEALINSLKVELERLKKEMAEGKSSSDELAGVQDLMSRYGENFEEKIAKASEMEKQRQEFLEDAGLTLQEMAASVGIGQDTPQLVNICTDPSLSGCLVYFLSKGEEITCGAASDSKIVLKGLGMADLMAVIKNSDDVEVLIEVRNESRVLVNGAKVTSSRKLGHGDRLILGYSFCFRLVIPLATECQDTQTKDTRTLENALSEVIPDQTEAFQQCRVYVEDLQSRVGTTRAQHFLLTFQKAITLVEEANVISKAVRRKDRFHFNVEVLVDTFQYQQDEPECVIRLKKYLTGIRRFKDIITRNIIEKNRERSGNSLTNFVAGLRRMNKQKTQGGLSERGGVSSEPFETVAVFDLAAFKVRMIYIREAYENFMKKQADFSKAEQDPWRVIEPWQLLPLMQETDPTAYLSKTEGKRTQEEKDKIIALVDTIPIEDLPQLKGIQEQHKNELEFYKRELEKSTREMKRYQQNWEKQEQEKERADKERHMVEERFEKERAAQQEEKLTWDHTERAKEAKMNEQAVRIRDLERQVERQRQEAGEAREQLRLALSVDPAIRGVTSPGFAALNAPSEVRLRHASEESAVAAHLATKLLGSLRDIKGDLRSQMAQREASRAETATGARAGNFYQSRVKKP